MSGGWAVLQRRHSAAASWKAAGWRDEGLPQRCRRRAGCRSAWKRHDDERHRCQSHGFSQSTESLGFAEPDSTKQRTRVERQQDWDFLKSLPHRRHGTPPFPTTRLGVNTGAGRASPEASEPARGNTAATRSL